MRQRLLALDAADYVPHELHRAERAWPETNCYVDLWIEVLHALELDPLAAAAFPLSTDFEGDQWTFFKYPPEDLRQVYGIDVAEMNVWLPVIDHVAAQLELGRLLTVEVDAWYLPDTQGVSYRLEHVKTTVVPNLLDRDASVLGYFHGAGYHELAGEDFDGALRLGAGDPGLPPYVELIKLDRLRRDGRPPVADAIDVLRAHLSRRPFDNPMVRFRTRLEQDLDWLATADLETFHRYAFGTCRQCGSAAELAASFVEWLDHHDGGGLQPTVARLRAVATAAKSLQFALARVVRGRSVDVGGPFAEMEPNWWAALDDLTARYGG